MPQSRARQVANRLRFAATLAVRKKQRLRVPKKREGEATAPPDYVGVGVQRCGTTWWDHLITSHPGVYRPEDRDKEIHFFDQFGNGGWSDDEIGAYASYFPRREGILAGEWTPRYLYDVWTPSLIREAAPDAKILVLLRDPIARYTSGQNRHRSWGGTGSSRVVQQAFLRGCYAAQLERLFQWFPREQVLVLQFEHCRDQTRQMLSRTYEFLGLEDTSFVPDLGPLGTGASHATMDEHWRRTLIRAYEPDVQRVAELVKDLDLDLWPNFRHLT